MFVRNLWVCLSLAAAGLGTAQAAPIAYQGTLASGTAANGSTGGFSWFLNQGTSVQFWEFFAAAGSTVTFEVDRLNANLDPALSFYSGTTTADTSSFDSNASFGGLTYIGELDDENPPFVGPANFSGDPFGSFSITASGMYTVAVGGFDSTDGGTYPYRITETTVSAAAIPEPSSYLLIAMGLGAIAWIGGAKRRGGSD